MRLNPKQLNLAKDLVMTGGRLIAVTGTAAVPSITFVGKLNSGIYTDANGSMNVSVAGASVFQVNASGAAVVGTLVATLSGNASSASKLATARTLSYTGDVTGSVSFDGSANVSAALTLPTVNATPGTFNNLTVNAKGLVTSASTVAYLTGNQTITISGDATGSGSTSVVLTLATVNANTGSFGSTTSVPTLTVNGKGLITAVSASAIAFPVSSVNGKTGAITLSTSDITEGTNLYFTQARARSSISATGSTTYNSTTGVIASPTLATVATTGAYADLLGKPTLLQAYRRGITAADVAGATGNIVSVTHSLGQMYVHVAVYDKNNKKIEPDEIILVDANSLQINFASFASDGSGVSPTSTVIFNIVIVG